MDRSLILPRFDKDDYVEVKFRILQFWEKYPEGSIVTEMLHVDDRCVRIKAYVYQHRYVKDGDSQLPLGVGHAEEYRITEADIKRDSKKQYEPNATSAVENCETSAVGRALAMAGFGVSKSVASRQEMEKVERELLRQENERAALDKPIEPAKVPTNGGPQRVLLTRDEARVLAGNIKKTGLEMSAVKLKLVGMGVEQDKTLSGTLQKMTKDEAQELYSWVLGESKTTEGEVNAPSS
jgi:hypothetical protein